MFYKKYCVVRPQTFLLEYNLLKSRIFMENATYTIHTSVVTSNTLLTNSIQFPHARCGYQINRNRTYPNINNQFLYVNTV